MVDGRIVIHGRASGQKVSNLTRDSRCCFSVADPKGYDYESDLACDTETLFESAVVAGRARIVEGHDEKTRLLRALADRFGRTGEIPEDRVSFTCVIEIIPESVTGKYRRPKA